MKLKLAKIINSFKKCNISNILCYKNQRTVILSNKINDTKYLNFKKKKKYTIYKKIRLIYYTFFYNENNDTLTVIETFLSPLIDFLSNFIRYLSWILVIFVWTLIINCIVLFYNVILPQLSQTTWYNFIIHFVLGNWLALNTAFHYFMGLVTSPGCPPKETSENIVSICKKCISPKPPRTHHCSICKKCILKMDHHCPWFNNCIGFYNHRYFFLFCVFLIIDITYLSTFGFHYYQIHVYPSENLNLYKLFLGNIAGTSPASSELYYKLTTIQFFVMFAAGFAILGLVVLNAYIISRGATNIELKSMSFPCFPSTYDNPKNPYDLGFKNNWKVFLGFQDKKSFFLRVILPSYHKPLGNGIDWNDYHTYACLNLIRMKEVFSI